MRLLPLVAVLFAVPACTGPCLRHSDCPAELLCMQRSCVMPPSDMDGDVPLASDGGPSMDGDATDAGPADGGMDAPMDAGTADALALVDARMEVDADMVNVDGGPLVDASTPDAGASDAGASDAAVPDADVPDAAVSDAGVPDAAVPDAAAPDAAPPTDAGATDAGEDAGS